MISKEQQMRNSMKSIGNQQWRHNVAFVSQQKKHDEFFILGSMLSVDYQQSKVLYIDLDQCTGPMLDKHIYTVPIFGTNVTTQFY